MTDTDKRIAELEAEIGLLIQENEDWRNCLPQRDTDQQIKALESVLNACCPVSGYVINDESSRNYIACEIEQLRKGANDD